MMIIIIIKYTRYIEMLRSKRKVQLYPSKEKNYTYKLICLKSYFKTFIQAN